jgi:hypothetical protein
MLTSVVTRLMHDEVKMAQMNAMTSGVSKHLQHLHKIDALHNMHVYSRTL